MTLRKRAIGDLYLAASVLFIFLSFVYFGAIRRQDLGVTFLIMGLVIAIFGIFTKNTLVGKEKAVKQSKKKK